MHFEEANLLLDRGTDPTLGGEDRKPLAELNKLLKLSHQILMEASTQYKELSDEMDVGDIDNVSANIKRLKEIIENLNKLKQRINEKNNKKSEEMERKSFKV